MANIHSNIQGDNMETQKQYDDDMIRGLFNNFIEAGGDPKVTDFKKHLNDLIDVFVKPLCRRSAKSSRSLPDVVNWHVFVLKIINSIHHISIAYSPSTNCIGNPFWHARYVKVSFVRI